MEILGNNAIVIYENNSNKTPHNSNLLLDKGNASVNKYWLTIVDIDSHAKVILINIGKSSIFGNTSKR